MLKRIGLALLVILLAGMPMAASASPPGQAVCSGNVLRNPGFEEGYSTRGSDLVVVGNGWEPWWHNGSEYERSQGYLVNPEYRGVPIAAGSEWMHSGVVSQQIRSEWSTHSGGILQQVSVTPDSALTLSAWVLAWSTSDPLSTTVVSPGEYRVSVGIDPTGGTDGLSSNIVWSDEVVEYGTWINLSVQARASASAITVFLRGRPEYRVQLNESFWDDVCLTVVAPTRVPTKPPPPPTATNTPTVTQTPTATSTPTPSPGSISVLAFQDNNRDGVRDSGDALLPGAVFTLMSGSGTAIGTYTTDGLSEPYAFEGLQAGTYKLAAAAPLGYAAVGQSTWTVTLQAGQQMDLGFSANFLPSPTPTTRPSLTATAVPPTATPTPAPSGIAGFGEALYNVSGLIVLGLAVVLAVLVFLALQKSKRPQA